MKDILLTILWPFSFLWNLIKYERLSKNVYYDWLAFIAEPAQSQFFEVIQNLGFLRVDGQRSLVAQHQLPTEIYNVIGQQMTEAEDMTGIAEEIVKSRMEPVLLKLLNSGWIDTITLKHIYGGNGLVITFMSNIYENQFQELRQSNKFWIALIAGCIHLLIYGYIIYGYIIYGYVIANMVQLVVL